MCRAASSPSPAASAWRASTARRPRSSRSTCRRSRRVAFTVTAEADGRSARITPSEPLTAGVVYRFTLTAADGRTLDSWAFQAHQAAAGRLDRPRRPGDRCPDEYRDRGHLRPGRGRRRGESHHHRAEGRRPVRAARPDHRLRARQAPRPRRRSTPSRSPGRRRQGTGDALESDVRFRFETTGAPTTGKARIRFEFTNDVFDSATSERPEMAVWVDQAVEDDRAIRTPPKSVTDRRRPTARPRRRHRGLPPGPGVPELGRGSSAPLVPTKGLVRVAASTPSSPGRRRLPGVPAAEASRRPVGTS